MRGTERVSQEFPLCIELLLIVTRMGRDYRPGLHKRIEQVARKGSPSSLYSIEGTAWKVRQTTLSENVRRTVDRGRGGPPSSNRDQPDHSLTSQHPDICDV